MPKAIDRAAWLALGVFLGLTVLVYWPSLSGGYLFDDSYYVQDPNVMVTSLRLGDWVRAALSQSGANQFRALSMLSFAANYYLTGANPWWYKLTNVGIHIVNGVLLFQLLRQLLSLQKEVALPDACDQPKEPSQKVGLFAAALTGLWLVAPINVTGVAYMSQRIESLATTFVFLGLFLYLRDRRRQFASNRSSNTGWMCIFACTVVGMTAKESAALLPLYTACIEFAITGFRNRDGRASRSAIWMHIVFLLLPLLAGLFWISRWDFSSVAHLRTFTIGQRLLTEPRVLVDYLAWTLFPHLSALTFYHDDFPLSLGLLDPPTTLAAILFIGLLLAIAVWQRKPRPLFCLGILWFFAGHAMTATIIPLELVFEHRNYFSSAGILLAVASLINDDYDKIGGVFKAAIACSVIAFFSFTTFQRAVEWSNPLRLAHAEAAKRPDSMRAQYGLAQTLIVAAGPDLQSPLLTEARKVLDRVVFRPDSGIGPAQALIFLDGRERQKVDPALWQSMIKKMDGQPLSETDINSVIFLYRCMQHGICEKQMPQMLNVFIAAMASSGYNPNVMSAYSDFAFIELHDAGLAERLTRDVVQQNPHVAVYHANLVQLLIASGQLDKAAIEIDSMKSLNHLGSLDVEIANLRKRLSDASKTAAPPSDGSPAASAHTGSLR